LASNIKASGGSFSNKGVLSESIVSYQITWDNPGGGQQPKWDQNKQSIEIHETDVYPDLQYTSAFAAPLYVKYTSGSLLNDLINEINKVIDSQIGKQSDKKEEPKKQETPVNEAYLNAGPTGQKQLPAGPDQKELPAGPAPNKQIGQGEPGGALVKYEPPQPPAVIDNKPKQEEEPDVTPDDQTTITTTLAPQGSQEAYTVTVYGDKLRFLEGESDRSGYGGIKFLYKVSNNLTKTVSGEKIDNTAKIWAEVKMKGLLGRTFKLEFGLFNEKEFKFGGNLLAQVLPSIELSFTPDQNSVYSKEKPELDIADVIKATNITLSNKTTAEIKAMQKQIQKEIEVREPAQKETRSGKQSASADNK
jgi:hypothetical protein